MKVAIMQPYFFPYVGYFQLIEAVDLFVLYDNIEYTKKGWINRNRILQNGKDAFITIPLKKDSDFLHVMERKIAKDFKRGKLLNQIKSSYQSSRFFSDVFPLVEKLINNNEDNLFEFLYFSIREICEYLKIQTNIIRSSSINIDHSLKKQGKVIAFCKELSASEYINLSGGVHMYSREEFDLQNLKLSFIKTRPFNYRQFQNEHVPWLSIIDVMMFNPARDLRVYLETGFELI